MPWPSPSLTTSLRPPKPARPRSHRNQLYTWISHLARPNRISHSTNCRFRRPLQGTSRDRLFSKKAALSRAAQGSTSLSPNNAIVPQSREQIYSSFLPRTALRAAMGKTPMPISGTSGPPHPLQPTTQPILGDLPPLWPKNLGGQPNTTRSLRRCVLCDEMRVVRVTRLAVRPLARQQGATW